jgi:hypothetical protein
MRSEAVDVDHGQFVGRRLKDCPVVIGLHERLPVGRRSKGRRDWRRLERFAEMCQGLTLRGRSRRGLRPLVNLRFEVSRLLPTVSSEPDVAATPRALQRKLLPHPSHQLCPCNPRRIVGAGLLGRVSRVAAASCNAPVVRMPARRGLLPLADVPDRE